jgi:excisionase family DNA binding protein
MFCSYLLFFGNFRTMNTVNVISPAITNGAEQPVTTAQLAEYLQVTERTLATYRAQRRIPFWKINARNFRYRLSDVEKALAK